MHKNECQFWVVRVYKDVLDPKVKGFRGPTTAITAEQGNKDVPQVVLYPGTWVVFLSWVDKALPEKVVKPFSGERLCLLQ